ncbi:hypothetical protein VNO80_01267 [Phaseolus coccineus]|uniref:Uncharacterized protein n=1 Tax=Phaseolus coccineus TaxID=3886 RepID=A0AAN9RSK2_PHACN
MITAAKTVSKLQLKHGLALDRVYTNLFMTSLDMAVIPPLLRRPHQVGMVCIQETKSKNLELALLSQLWGTNDIRWVQNEELQSVRGLVTMWRSSYFEMIGFIKGANYTVIEGVWKDRVRRQVTMVNMYGFGTLREKSKDLARDCGYQGKPSVETLVCFGGF